MKEETCRFYTPEGKCASNLAPRPLHSACIGKGKCQAHMSLSYEPADVKPREQEVAGGLTKTELPLISSKDDALQAIIFLLSEWEIQPQEIVEEYNRLVH